LDVCLDIAQWEQLTIVSSSRYIEACVFGFFFPFYDKHDFMEKEERVERDNKKIFPFYFYQKFCAICNVMD